MQLADYVINYLYDNGVSHIFCGNGGGIMYLVEAVRKHGLIKPVFCHHEQSAGYAAVGYAKHNNKIGVCLVTTGCGGMNIMTPLLVAYQDYVSLMVIQGQTDTKYVDYSKRKFGVQGMNTEAVVSPLCSFVSVTKPEDIKTAFDLCKNKPVWCEVPLFAQCKEVQ